MKRTLTGGLGVCLLSVMAVGAAFGAPKNKGEIRVLASISTTEALTEIANSYQQETGQKIRLNFAGSNLLAQQIQLGVAADIFFPADEKWMDVLQAKGYIRQDTRRSFLNSMLVIVVNKDSPLVIRTPTDLLSPKFGKIAMADPRALPSGIHAREYLESKKIWGQIEPRAYLTDNARATLAAVEADNAGAGFVYKADALLSPKVRIAYEAVDHPPIPFPVALTTHSMYPDAAAAFESYMMQPQSLEVFKRYGFTIVKMTSP